MILEEERRREGIDSMILEMVTGPPEQVAPCIRNALERGWEQALPGALIDFQQQRKEEIERVCSRYYSEFLGSVQELLTAKSRSAALKHQIVQFNEDIKHTGQDTLKTGHELQRQKVALRNVQAATIVLAQCREMTSLLALAKQQIEEGRHCPALKTLDRISHQLSMAVDQPFIRRVEAWLPALETHLKVAALRDVAQWLVDIRGKTVSIGQGALRKCVGHMTGQGAPAASTSGTSSSSSSSSDPDHYWRRRHHHHHHQQQQQQQQGVTLTPARLLLQQVNQVVDYSTWMAEDDLLLAVPPFLRSADGEEQQIFSLLSENLDPLHRALHVHAHLGALGEFQLFYVNNRLPQATLPSGGSFASSTLPTSAVATAPGATSAARSPSPTPLEREKRGESSEEWIVQIQEAMLYFTGFFVTEHLALRATDHPEGLLPVTKLEDCWRGIQRDLCTQMEAKTMVAVSPALLVQLKQTALLLAFTLGEDCFRFDTQPLLVSVREVLREKYVAAQLGSLERVCGEIVENDEFQPMTIASEWECGTLIHPFGLEKRVDLVVLSKGGKEGREGGKDEYVEGGLVPLSPVGWSVGKKGGGGKTKGGGSFPMTFPFSAIVPRLSLEVYKMTLFCFLFGLQLQHLDKMEATLLRLTEEGLGVLSRLLNRDLEGAMEERANFTISKACQISVDAAALALMTGELERLLVGAAARFGSSTEAASRGIPASVREGRRELENTGIAAQHLVFELMQAKIDELLIGGIGFVEWEAGRVEAGPRPYVEDVVNYMQVTFMCLTYLPQTAREGLHFASCAHIHTVMLSTLLDPRKVTAVNTSGLYNFSLDLRALEAFADSCGVVHLRECFAELQQTLGALLHRDIHTLMLDEGLRQGIFPKLQTANLVTILEKYKPLGLLAQVKNQRGGGGHGGAGGGVDLPYLEKRKVVEYLKALHKQLQHQG